ncbi:MAG: TonB family protein [Gammaproteobacteria bacterium]|nr:TonB family protein [Gammaproteobacteria bacterium]MDH3769212.1 TonB family protein [Gammaproteobacteria bacterium]
MRSSLLLVTLLIAGLSEFAYVQEVDDSAAADTAPSKDDVQPQSENTSNGEDLATLKASIAQLRQRGKVAEALPLAKRVATLVEEQHGATLRLGPPLITVIELQLELPDNPAAEQTLGRLIRIIESQDSVFSLDLVDPLTVLAELYSSASRKDEAITALRRARHISHRNLGILNLEQIELADQLAMNYYEMGSIKEANRENRFAFRVNIHEYGADSAELVPAINKLASWYELIGEFGIARQHYKKSVDLIEKDYGENDLRLVAQLQNIAGTYRKQNILKGEGKDALFRAVQIQQQHPEADVVSRARALTDIGDWFMLTSRRRDAIDLYAQAWNLLTADGASPEKGDVIFGRPKRLRFNPPLPNPLALGGVSEIHVDVEFSVTPEGSVTNLSVKDASAHWRVQNEVRLAMRNARYRPQFADGRPTTADMTFRWTFRVPENASAPE